MLWFFLPDLALCYLVISDNPGALLGCLFLIRKLNHQKSIQQAYRQKLHQYFLRRRLKEHAFAMNAKGLVLLSMITRLPLVYILCRDNQVSGSQVTDPQCFCLFLPAPNIHAPHWSQAALEKWLYITENSKIFYLFHTCLL